MNVYTYPVVRAGIHWVITHNKSGVVVHSGFYAADDRDELPKDGPADVKGYTIRHRWLYATVKPEPRRKRRGRYIMRV